MVSAGRTKCRLVCDRDTRARVTSMGAAGTGEALASAASELLASTDVDDTAFTSCGDRQATTMHAARGAAVSVGGR